MSERENISRLYQAVDGDDAIIRLLTTILERQDAFLDRQTVMDAKIDGHMAREEGLAAQFLNALPVKPDGRPDVDGHREFHNTLIEEGKARAAFYRELRVEVMKKGLFGLLMVIGFLIVYWWNGEVKK